MVSVTLGNLLDGYTRHGIDSLKEYTISDIETIVNKGSLEDKRRLSRTFFIKDGFYKKIIMHYAYLSKYCGLLIPNTTFGSSLSDSVVKKRYKLAIDYIEDMKLQKLFGEISVEALVNGAYFGVVSEVSSKKFSLI